MEELLDLTTAQPVNFIHRDKSIVCILTGMLEAEFNLFRSIVFHRDADEGVGAEEASVSGTPDLLTRHHGVFLPVSLTKPPPSDSGLPDRFDRLSKKTGQIQISNQKR